jgi:ankyrin repeat protein
MQPNTLEEEALKVLNSVIGNEKKLPDLDLQGAQSILQQKRASAQLELLAKNNPHFQNYLGYQLLDASRQTYDFKERSNTIFTLVAQGVDVNVRCHAINNTPLHWAIVFENTYNIICLIFAGANVNAQNCDGFTPLHLAAIYNQPEVAQVLLRFGASKKLLDIHNRTPLSIAKQYRFNELLNVLAF